MRKFYDCGIDLGTTNSCISVPNNDNTCTIIDNTTDGKQVTPSVAWVRGGRIIIGQRAYNCSDAENVKKEFKRDMGTEAVYLFKDSDKQMTPVELSAEILKSMRGDAERRTNREIRDAVVTVPAAFNMVQCEATKRASEMAGFRNVILLQEPIAASIAYGAKPEAKNQYWLVFDYGGGTLDVSVISTNDGRLDNINSKGNNHMGGKDLDRLLYEKVILPRLKHEFNLSDGLDINNLAIVMSGVEKCKIELSNQPVGYFETFSATDNSGKIIDVMYEIDRSEFENAISDEINSAVKIAREALAESKVGEDRFDKIILVGGSTFVPLVRQRLQENFQIKLESSLNPMTVVSEGAALFAATMEVENEIQENEVGNNEYLLDLKYEIMTSESCVNVVGKIMDSVGKVAKVKIDCISSEDSENALWTSGWCEMLDVSQGIFDIDVRMCNLNGKNLFRISAVSDDGSAITLIGYLFEILHKATVLKIIAPPLPHNVGIMVTDGTDNLIDWIFEKDTKLPVTSDPIPYLVNKTLKPNEDSDFEIRIYEGDKEFTYNPPANDLIRRVHIKTNKLTRILETGTEVEITISIDENRCVTVTGYVPLYDYELEAETLGNSEENYINYQVEMNNIEEKMVETKHSLDIIKSKGIDVGKIQTEFNYAQNEFEKYFDLIDVANDEVHKYIRNFYRIQTAVIDLERKSRGEIQQQTDSANIKRMDGNIRQFGSEMQKSTYESYKHQLDSTKDSDSRRFIIGKMDRLESDVVFNSFEWLKMIYLSNYASSNNYSNQQKADFWKAEVHTAIQNGDTGKLRQAINNLVSLTIRSASESVSIRLADLKKI